MTKRTSLDRYLSDLSHDYSIASTTAVRVDGRHRVTVTSAHPSSLSYAMTRARVYPDVVSVGLLGGDGINRVVVLFAKGAR